jgi:SSS family solute:Na+ symporter
MPSNVASQGLTYWDYLIVAAYGIGMLWIGWYCSRRQTDMSEYFLGGRRMNWIIVGLSTMATLVSTITYLTTPGEIIKNGPGVLWASLSVFIAFFFIGYLIIPRIMAHKIVSGYQLLEAQFGHGIRQAAAVLFVLTRLAWAGLVIYTCSFALAAMTGWPIEYILVGVGIVTTIYTTAGGIRAVMITDTSQAVILMVGAFLVVIYAMISAHSFTGWWPSLGNPEVKTMLHWPRVPLYPTSFTRTIADQSQRITIIGIIIYYVTWWIMTASSDQMAIQRYLSTKDAPTARKSFLTNAVANAILGLTLAMCGFALLGYFLQNLDLLPSLKTLKPGVSAEELSYWQGLTHTGQQYYSLTKVADKIFPWFIAHVLPPGLSGLLLAALFAAAMSSISSGVNSITTVLMVDFEKVFARGLSEARQLLRARVIGIVIGATAIGISFIQQTIRGNFMEVAQKINGFFVAPLGALFFMAFFMKRANKWGAWAAIVVGFLVAAFISYYMEIYEWYHRAVLKQTNYECMYMSFTLILPLSFIASILAGYIVSALFARKEKKSP